MKKLFSLLLCIASFLLCPAQEGQVWKIDKLEQHIQKADGPLVVNFWATFCKPCVEELPYFLQLAEKYKAQGLQLLLVSLDFTETYPKARVFAAKHKFSDRLVLLNETNADVFCPRIDSSWSGVLPASLFVNNKTGYRKFYEEQLPQEKVEAEIRALLARKRL